MLLRLFLVSVFTVELSPCGKKIPNLFQVAIPVAALLLQLVLIRILCAETGNESGKSYPDIHSLLLLSALFDVSLDQLIKGDLETMKQEVNAADVRAMNRDAIIFSILLAATIILPAPLLKWFGLYGLIPELLIWGAAMYFALRLERIKKANNVQSYREILAFSEGRKLDEIEQKVEAGKRPYQKLLLVLLTAGITLLVGMVLSWLLL